MQRYQMLFSPVKVGKTEVKNRIFMTPMSTNLATPDGYVTEELVAHYAARARGGAGLLVTEVNMVEPVYKYLPGVMTLQDDSYIPGWKKLSGAVHEYGAKICPQLFHPAYMAFPLPGTPQFIAPSWIGPYYAKEAPRPVTVEELQVLVRQFGEAAYRAKEGGADGAEIHAAHAHGLLGGFLSPLYNKRTDEYGGDVNGRLRLTLEVVREVRRVCGEDFIINVRISGDDYSVGGQSLVEGTYIAKELERAGADMLHVSGGTTVKRASSITAPGTPQASHCHLSEEIRKHVKIPVATVGRVNEPWIAEEMIENGKADICMMGRALMCDSEFPNKAQEGREEEIRPCIGCLKCLNGIMFGKRVECSVNPSLAQENEDTVEPALVKKNILVAGGGPGGMEAAFVAARRGHHVVLAEKAERLGGAMCVASVPVAKQDIAKVIKFMARRLENQGVEILLNTEVTPELMQNRFAGYEVICAAGAEPVVIPAFTSHKSWAVADDILAGRKSAGQHVVIIGGGSVGCETADYLAPLINDRFPRNRRVTIIEMLDEIMKSETGPGRSLLVQRLQDKGVEMICGAMVERVEESSIVYSQGECEHHIEGVDTLILSVGYRPSSLAEKLSEMGITCHSIGDCVQSGSIKEAVHMGYETAREL